MKDELPIPAKVENAKRAMEMARIWIADGNQHVVLSPNLWEDPGAWGLMLVDLARHISKAYAEQGRQPEEALAKIKEAFDAEWVSPTD